MWYNKILSVKHIIRILSLELLIFSFKMSIQSCVSWTIINCHCVVIEFVLIFFFFFSTGLAVILHFLSFPFFPLDLTFLKQISNQNQSKERYLFHAVLVLASFAPFSCLQWQDICRWFLVSPKYITVFPLWQMDLRLLVLNKCRFTIHNFTGFVLYITGLNILSQNSSAWHFQLIQGPCQFF